MSRARPALVVLWACVGFVVATLVILGIAQWRIGQNASVESVGSRPPFSASSSPSSPTPTPSSPSPSASPTPSPEPSLIGAPVRVEIPALAVDAKVLPVALDTNDAIEIPADITKVGWYQLGVPPGADRGSAVLVGHRDGREQGRGVFYFLGSLDVGDKVTVRNSRGEGLKYKVVARESINKKRLPYEELFAVDGAPRLTLISCGGVYDRDNGGYQDNVVVTAVPLFDPLIDTSGDAGTSPSASPMPSPIATPQA